MKTLAIVQFIKELPWRNIFIGFLVIFLLLNFKKMVTWLKLKFSPDLSNASVQLYKEKSIIDSDYAVYLSDLVYEAMAGFGTNEKALDFAYEKLQNNPNNFLALYNAFGKRKYYLFGANDWFGTEKDFLGWLISELNDTKMEKWYLIARQAGF